MNKLYRDTTSSLHKHLEYINKIWGICVYFIFSWTFVNLKESFTKYGLNANKQPTCTHRLTMERKTSASLQSLPLQLPSPGIGRVESKSQLQINSHESVSASTVVADFSFWLTNCPLNSQSLLCKLFPAMVSTYRDEKWKA